MRIAVAAALLVMVAGAASVRAQSPEDKAAATALFDEGRRLMKEGQYQKACAKFEASSALNPGLGTRLNLADCYVKLGRLASAWTIYREVINAAVKAGDAAREQYARGELAKIEPRLARVTIKLAAGAEVGGLAIERDGSAVPSALLDSPVPVDAGTHKVAASAPGRTSWSTEVTVTDGSTVTVEVPPLPEAEVKVEPAPPPAVGGDTASLTVPLDRPPPDPNRGRGLRITGLVTMGLGVAAVGLGVKFGLDAKSLSDDLTNATGTWTDAHDQMIADGETAEQRMYIFYGIGGGAVVTGAVLYFIGAAQRPDAPAEPAVGLRPLVGGDTVGLAAAGRF